MTCDPVEDQSRMYQWKAYPVPTLESGFARVLRYCGKALGAGRIHFNVNASGKSAILTGTNECVLKAVKHLKNQSTIGGLQYDFIARFLQSSDELQGFVASITMSSPFDWINLEMIGKKDLAQRQRPPFAAPVAVGSSPTRDDHNMRNVCARALFLQVPAVGYLNDSILGNNGVCSSALPYEYFAIS